MTDSDGFDVHQIEVETSSGRRPAQVIVGETADGVSVRLQLDDRSWESWSDMGAFEAFKAIRAEMEGQGRGYPVCYGASECVGQSAMAARMGLGEKIYRLTMGQPGRTVDLVGAFETGPDVVPVGPDRQSAFYERWLDSLSA